MNEPENILLQYMRKFDERLARFETSMREFGNRITSVERQLSGLRSDVASLHGDIIG